MEARATMAAEDEGIFLQILAMQGEGKTLSNHGTDTHGWTGGSATGWNMEVQAHNSNAPAAGFSCQGFERRLCTVSPGHQLLCHDANLRAGQNKTKNE